ncbi:MAG: hypothetical protein RBT57_03245 [Paludibacter sp.]|jgi:hypothetical protein|nr:hypothetical protein [Paludibacter sp.]
MFQNYHRFFLAFLFTVFVYSLPAQDIIAKENSDSTLHFIDDSTQVHEITLFLMPTMLPLDWSSPSALYASMLQIYIKTLGLKDNYLIGHVSMRLNSPLLNDTLYIAQSSKRWQERIDLVLKDRVGFGILGADLEGRIEPAGEIKHKLKVYRDRNLLGFITFRINKPAMKRMLTFLNEYQKKITEHFAASDFYGGAFWPRYHYEGAGCSAFGMALLDVAGLIPDAASQWRIDVKIPMNLVGGKFNEGKKIKNRTIKRTKSWYEGDGRNNIDYVNYFVYDPAIMYNWVLEKHKLRDSSHFQLVSDGTVPGLYKDARNIILNPSEPIFMQRPDTNLFINHYYQRINLQKR